ncbi:hypothetical protein BPOR_0270g00070 [Botrytis porri]|uniref:Uncharacterized protein n=1 Tax=Botrytis porri TaxID=87229 RepID=A0A4Z1KLE1_9HELO|nr:hypothetical protein BPOR_0270g00070 [Botrytis porri]
MSKHKHLVRQLHRVLEDGGLITVNYQGQFTYTSKRIDLTPAWILYKEIPREFPLPGSVYKVTKAVGKDLAQLLMTPTKAGLLRSGTIALGECLEKAMASSGRLRKFRELENLGIESLVI